MGVVGNHIDEVRDLIHEVRNLIHEVRDLIHEVVDLIHEFRDLTHEVVDLIHEVADLIHEVADLIHEVAEHMNVWVTLPQPLTGQSASGGPGATRTPDKRFRKPLLYPPELRGHSRRETGRG